ncbi:hypothetical protein AKJ52_02715, partial [candidate division MSBL1 archaeon SCGC-AAA382C18]
MDVLMIDDEPDFVEQAKMFLEKEEERLDIDTALTGEEGWSKLEENAYDGIISDYKMRGMDGLELLKKVREERDTDIPFILFTGKGREEVAMKALNFGVDRYLQKKGDPKSQYGVLADAITQEIEHWHSKKEMRRSEKKYRELSEKSLVGTYIIQNDVFKYVNPEFCKIFGYDEDELIDEKYLKLVSPEDKELVKEGVENRQSGNGEEKRYTFQGLHKTGRKIDIEVFSVPSTYQGETAVVGTLIDITERKRAKEKFRSLFENIPIMAFVLDEEGRLKEFNEAFRQKIGYSREELIGKHLTDLPNILSEEDREKTLERFKKIINGECKDWTEIMEIHELDDPPTCPKCGSGKIGMVE